MIYWDKRGRFLLGVKNVIILVMEEIGKKLKNIISNLYNLDVEPSVTEAPKNFQADFSSNVAMAISKQVGKKPREVAEEIVTEFKKDSGFEVEIAGPGFLNFRTSDEYFETKIADYCDNFMKNISQDEYSGQTVVCEFSDPNPFKVLHVGHLYTSIVGDSISRLIEFAGGKVIRANFGGDVGLHVAKTLYSVIKNREDTADINVIARNYVSGTQAYDDDETAHAEITDLNKKIYEISKNGAKYYGLNPDGSKLGEGFGETDGGDKNTISENQSESGVNEKKTSANSSEKDSAGSEEKSPADSGEEADDYVTIDGKKIATAKVAELYFRGRTVSYKYFEDFYAKIGVKFDKYYPESTVAERGLSEVKAHIGDVYEESDGAIVYKGEKDGLHTRVFINKNGLPTYETKDIGLLFTKNDDWHFDKSIVITGNDIIDYMKVVLTSVSKYAPGLVEKTIHLTHGNVRLPGNEKMSSRKGNFIKAVDILNEVDDEMKKMKTEKDSGVSSVVESADAEGVKNSVETDTGKSNVAADSENTTGAATDSEESKANRRLEKAIDAGEREQDELIEEKISLAAIKYAFLKYKIGGNIIFDAKESISMTGNSGPYLQYSAVRAAKIIGNLLKNGVSSKKDDWKLTENERNLIKKLLMYPEELKVAISEFSPSKLCTYLYETAQEFSRFYETTKVAGSEYEFERGQIVLAYLKTLTHGLSLLGIEVPERM